MSFYSVLPNYKHLHCCVGAAPLPVGGWSASQQSWGSGTPGRQAVYVTACFFPASVMNGWVLWFEVMQSFPGTL